MEKRTQPRLEWVERNGGYLGVVSDDCFMTVTLWVWPDTVEIVAHDGGGLEEWRRETRKLYDVVDAMVFAEDRALELCKAMFGKLLEVERG